ncbi:MAG: hypothetical protein ABSA33_01705 [Candidatus Micrarchaeaceae archaeon]
MEGKNEEKKDKTAAPKTDKNPDSRAQGHRSSGEDEKQSLNALIKESNNPEAIKLKEDIDNLRKDRSKLIARIKDSRRRLSYKEAEAAAIDRLLKMRKEEDKDGAKRRRVGYLKRMKARLEFKISTEASSLAQEKDIIRKINEINSELNEALASVRLERKVGFISKDIEEYRKSIVDVNTKIGELDTRLDGLYVGLRKTLGIGSWQNKQQQQQRPRKQQRAQESGINLEDIAVIKKKDAKS